MKILWIFFFLEGGGVITKLDYSLGSFLCILRSFLKIKVKNGGIFLGCLKFLIFFGGRMVDAGPRAYIGRKYESTPWGPDPDPPLNPVMIISKYVPGFGYLKLVQIP